MRTSATTAPPLGRAFWPTVIVAALALQAVLAWLEWRPRARPLWGDEATYWAAAEQVAAGGEPELHLLWPPLYPRLLSVFVPLGSGARVVVHGVQLGLLAVSALLLRGLGSLLFPGGPAGDVAAALLVLDPQVAAFAPYLWPELLHLALFLLAWWVVAARHDRSSWLVVAGVALGLALLTKSLLLGFLPALLLPLLGPGPFRQRVLRPALVLTALFVTLLPTLLDHRQRYGFTTVANSSAFNAWVGLNDRARRNFVDEIVGDELAAYLRSAPDARERDARLRVRIVDRVAERGSASLLAAQLGRQYFRLFDHHSFLTEQLPGGGIAVFGWGYRAPPGWLAAVLSAWAAAIYAAVLVAAPLALATAPLHDRRQIAVPVLFLLYNLAIFLVLHVMSRYRVQLLPVLLLAAGAAIAWLLRPQRARGPACWSMACLMSALLLFLAFGGTWLP